MKPPATHPPCTAARTPEKGELAQEAVSESLNTKSHREAWKEMRTLSSPTQLRATAHLTTVPQAAAFRGLVLDSYYTYLYSKVMDRANTGSSDKQI